MLKVFVPKMIQPHCNIKQLIYDYRNLQLSILCEAALSTIIIMSIIMFITSTLVVQKNNFNSKVSLFFGH